MKSFIENWMRWQGFENAEIDHQYDQEKGKEQSQKTTVATVIELILEELEEEGLLEVKPIAEYLQSL